MKIAEPTETAVLRAEDVPTGAQRAQLESLAALAREVSIFCLTHRGRCFATEDWTGEKVFKYVCWQLINGNVFMQRDGVGRLRGVLFAWADRMADVMTREAMNAPQFDWQPKASPGDAVMVAQVIGSRAMGYGWRKLALERWPDLYMRRVFTWRRGKLHELDYRAVKRFCAKGTN